MIREKKILGVLAVAAAVFVATGLLAARFDEPASKPSKPDNSGKKLAAVFDAKDVSTGKKVALKDYKGKVVVLNFWATWCGPCVSEIPDLVKLYNANKNQLVVIGASVDNSADEAKKFAKNNKMTYPVIWATAQMQKDYGGISSIPTTFFINKNGEIVDKIVGAVSLAEFEKKVKPLLKETPAVVTPDQPEPPASDGAYNFSGVDVTTGKAVKLSDYNKKKVVVVVNFWATWCGPCVNEIPGFVNLQNKYKGKVQFIGISLDDDAAVAKKFVKKQGIQYPIMMSKPEIESAYGGIPSIPTTFFIGENGKILDKVVGSLDEAALEAKLKKYMK
ncbi:MAG: hypothetical protein A2Y33_03745 [Spirochaetes bacterium GWF1_51_8]|nr:MAG: hypothetical protein A2Y33_03745 [Spirochaetes bacterium GWF1_51_8]